MVSVYHPSAGRLCSSDLLTRDAVESGAAVGLINEALPAFDVVRQVQKEARDRIHELGRMTASA